VLKNIKKIIERKRTDSFARICHLASIFMVWLNVKKFCVFLF
jgi:hypothetical protein